MFCEKCGNQIKENEEICSNCGAPVKISLDDAVKNEVPIDINTSIEDPEKLSDSIQNITFNTAERPDNTTSIIKYKIPIIAGVLVVLFLIIGIANASRINNLIRKTFSSPESYYQFVEKKAMEEMCDLGGDLYHSLILESLNIYDKSVSSEISVELGKEGEELLELAGLAGMDLSWLKSIQASGNLSIKDSMFSMGFGTSLNQKDVVSGNIIMDIENGEMFLQIPELTKTYMGIDLKNTMNSHDYRQFEEFQETQKTSRDLIKALPSEDQVENILKKYGSIALKCVDDVSIDSKALKVSGIEKKYTELKVTYNSDTFKNIIEAVLEEMAEDKDIENYIINVAETGGEDGNDIYKEFRNDIEDMLDFFSVDDDIKIVMKVYVDGKGDIKGRTIEWEDYWGSKQSISILTLQKGNEVGFEFSINSGSEKIALSGSGKKSGNKVTGDYELKYNGVSFLDITTKKLNIEDLKKGYINGEIGIKLSSKIGNLFKLFYSDYSEYASYIAMITDLQLKIDASNSENSSKCKIELIYGEENIVTMTASIKTGSGSNISTPNSKDVVMIENFNDMLDWLKEINWINVLNHLEKTDLPDNILDLIEDIADALEDGNFYKLYRLFL